MIEKIDSINIKNEKNDSFFEKISLFYRKKPPPNIAEYIRLYIYNCIKRKKQVKFAKNINKKSRKYHIDFKNFFENRHISTCQNGKKVVE
ncbi:MAG TPA: hypothetical protein DCE65_08760 [Clostridiales bacterium]|nr:hypothetical protein [Clostridiales bacterium]